MRDEETTHATRTAATHPCSSGPPRPPGDPPAPHHPLRGLPVALLTGVLLFCSVVVARAQPANDDIANATPITTLPFTDESVDTTQATTDAIDPLPDCGGNFNTVWYVFTPTENLTLLVSARDENYDNTLSVYTGSPGALTQIICNDDPQALFDVTAGTTYYFMVGTWFNDQGGTFTFHAEVVIPPSNDDFASATVIPEPLPFTDTLNTIGATPDGPGGCYGEPNNVWYILTLSKDTVVRLTTDGSNYFAFIDVFERTDQGNYNDIACDTNINFEASAGTTYYISVSSPYDPGGDLVFAVLDLGAPFQVTLSLNATGSFDPKTGSATIRGTVTCNQPAGVDVWGHVRQKLGRTTIIQGDFNTFVECDGATPWSATVRSDQGAFGGGAVEVSASASGCSPIDCGEDQATATGEAER